MKKTTFLLVSILFTVNLLAMNTWKSWRTFGNELSSSTIKKTATLITQEGSFYHDTNNGKIYIYFKGEWQWIYDWQTYSGCFDIEEAESKMVYGAGAPPFRYPLDTAHKIFRGFLGMKYRLSNGSWYTDGKVYLFPILSNGERSFYGYHITSPAEFDSYSFDWQKIGNYFEGYDY